MDLYLVSNTYELCFDLDVKDHKVMSYLCQMMLQFIFSEKERLAVNNFKLQKVNFLYIIIFAGRIIFLIKIRKI